MTPFDPKRIFAQRSPAGGKWVEHTEDGPGSDEVDGDLIRCEIC
jgi:hypothetical protein